ncbi:putative Polyprenyl synthetase [Leishmania utingensis]|uniref:Polyprenyl synthetase n=2 Tax=Viannia TaxID=37616 RepID=A0AAW3AI32_9TRYP
MTHMERFQRVYEEVQGFLLSDAEKRFEMDVHRKRYLKDMMDTTCLGGKYNRGLCVVDVAEAMAKDARMDAAAMERTLHDACVCGWMIEMLQAHFLVEDDIMDNSKTRRGRPCWYLHPGVTTQVAINDGLIVLAWATQVALHYFADRPFLAEVLRVFHDVDFTTTIGQLYDVTSMVDSAKLDANVAHANTTDYVEYTPFNHRRIVVYKTAYYTYWLPLVMGLLVSGTAEKVDKEVTHKVSMVMGEYFQVQDDVMDCFTSPEKLGKIGTDIEDAKCSWLAVTFLAIAPAEKVAEFKANYGSADPAKVAVIKQLYAEQNLLARFEEYEQGIVAEVEQLIAVLEAQNAAFAASVKVLWGKTYRRQR